MSNSPLPEEERFEEKTTYTLEAAARRLQVSPEEVLKKIRCGEIYAYRDRTDESWVIPSCGMKHTNQLLLDVLCNQNKILKELKTLQQKLKDM